MLMHCSVRAIQATSFESVECIAKRDFVQVYSVGTMQDSQKIQSSCYIRGCKHDLESSAEHIFPRSIGGRQTIRGILCRRHNNALGHEIDAGFAKAFRAFTVAVGIVPSGSGSLPWTDIKTPNRDYRMFADGRIQMARPKIKVSKDYASKMASLSIEASDEGALRAYLRGFQKKYPQINVDTAMEKAYKLPLLQGENQLRMEFPFPSAEVYRAASKCLCNVWGFYEKPFGTISALIGYVGGEEGTDVTPYYEGEIILQKPKTALLNSAVIVGDESSGKLIGYIEILDAFRLIVPMSFSYEGPQLALRYSEDCFTGEAYQIAGLDELNVDALLRFKDYGRPIGHNPLRQIQNAMQRYNLSVRAHFCAAAAERAAAQDYLKNQDEARYWQVFAAELSDQFIKWVGNRRIDNH